MEYISLYRKYRPQSFEEVIWQTSIVKILREELKQKKISHAYIFAGPKGTGKTTLARIFAKGLNCVNGPTDTPCLRCVNCQSIANGTSLDVIEIDAASNRGIDEIRDLKEKVQYVPVSSRYKVYIIDEAHMLTTQAFNALLKTIEEPPKNVVFILATTEPDKIPQTVTSRCEIFYFKPIPVNKIAEKIKEVVQLEGGTVNDQAASLLARLSYGSLRNALSLVEQVITVSKEITEEIVRNFLDVPDDQLVLEFLEAILKGDRKAVFEKIKKNEENGINPKFFLNSLIDFIDDLISLKIGDYESLKEKRDENTFLKMKEVLKSTSLKKLINISKTILDTFNQIKFIQNSNFVILINILDFIGELPQDDELKNEPIQTKGISEETINLVSQDFEEPKKEVDINRFKAVWQLIVSEVKKKEVAISVILTKLEPVSFKEGVLEILLDKPFYFELLNKKENKDLVEEAIKKVTLVDVKVVYIKPEEERKLTKEERIKELENKKEIKEILELFEGTITDVREEKNEKPK
ncbi:MAG: DNA polymerase III subunit gamma/tau [Caldisericaceae bacterium]